MKYQIVGADRETGEDIEITIDAQDEVAAEMAARRRNIMVNQVAPIRFARRTDAVQPGPALPLELGHVAGAPSVNVYLPRRSSSLGIASLVLGVVAFLFCWIPLLGIVSTPVSALGLILAIIALIVALFRRGTGIGYPIAGGLTSSLALFVAVSVTIGVREALRHVASATSQEPTTNQEIVRPTGRARNGSGEIGAREEPRPRQENQEQSEKTAYIAENLELYDVKATYMNSFLDGRVPGVLFKLRNKGGRSLDQVKVTLFFKDANGNIIAEQDFHPVLVTKYSFSGDNKPLKPGYVWQMERGKFYSAKSVPTEWLEGAVDASITDIGFSGSASSP